MATNNFYRTPHLTTISFAVGILLFFLPFAEIKCNGTRLASLSGTDLVTGGSPNMNSEFENMGRSFGSNNTTTRNEASAEKGKMYPLALVALLLGIGGLAFSLIKKGGYNRPAIFLGIVGAVALIILMIQVKSDINTQMKSESSEMESLSGMMKVSVDFTIWFFLCVLSYLAAAFFSYKQKDTVDLQEQPSASAPQVSIQNPGDQSEFPAAPSGGKDLG